MYKKNPHSKVFAPLAESFRKLGMIDDAMKILKEGIRHHPGYTLGYIVLANCYYDQQKFELTYNTLRPIISQNADNISLQKIFAQACIHLGHLEEALDTYKYLLFMSPKDKIFATEVKRLEDDLMVGHKKLTLEQIIKAPNLPAISAPPTQDDDWVQVNFGGKEPPAEKALPVEEISDEWVMKKPGMSDHPILQKDSVQERSLEDDFYADEFSEEGEIDEVNDQTLTSDAPLVSHTLIDLYCAQGYYDKAIELLEKILELNPEDQASRKKMQEVRALQTKNKPSNITEEDGHDELISIIENQVKAKSPQEIKLQDTFNSFLNAIKEKSINHR